jgi:hypothetical protein
VVEGGVHGSALHNSRDKCQGQFPPDLKDAVASGLSESPSLV